MPFSRRHLPVLLFAAAVLSMSGPWASSRVTGAVVEPIFLRFGLSPEMARAAHWALRVLGHLAAYGVFAVLALRSVRGESPAAARAAGLAFVLAVALAATDESLQSMAPGRGGLVADVLLDAIGAAMGLALVLAFSRRRVGAVPAPAPGAEARAVPATVRAGDGARG